MCCLKNEQETYEYLNSKLPNVGEKLKTKDGVVGEVQRVDVLRQKVKLIVEDENGDKEIQEYKIDDLLMRKKSHKDVRGAAKDAIIRIKDVIKDMERERIDDLGINGYQIIQKEQGILFWNGCGSFIRFCTS